MTSYPNCPPQKCQSYVPYAQFQETEAQPYHRQPDHSIERPRERNAQQAKVRIQHHLRPRCLLGVSSFARDSIQRGRTYLIPLPDAIILLEQALVVRDTIHTIDKATVIGGRSSFLRSTQCRARGGTYGISDLVRFVE